MHFQLQLLLFLLLLLLSLLLFCLGVKVHVTSKGWQRCMLMTRCRLCSNSTTKQRPCRCYERLEPDTGQFSLTCLSLARVARWFCRAGRTSAEARENERRSREKNKTRFSVAPDPISSRFLCPRPPLLLSNQNRHATQASLSYLSNICGSLFKILAEKNSLLHFQIN